MNQSDCNTWQNVLLLVSVIARSEPDVVEDLSQSIVFFVANDWGIIDCVQSLSGIVVSHLLLQVELIG